MSTNTFLPDDRTADYYDKFVAQWESEGRQESLRMLKLGAESAAKGLSFDLEFHYGVVDLQWVEGMVSLHNLCQELQVVSPLDSKICLQSETASRWVKCDDYNCNPHQWDSNGQVWVSTAVAL